MRKGFTLIELLVVVVILGLLVSVLAVNVGGQEGPVKRELTMTALLRLKGELDLFKLREGRPPARLEELVERGQLEELPRDAWKNPFQYRVPGARGAPYDLVSLGADGRPYGDLWNHPPQ